MKNSLMKIISAKYRAIAVTGLMALSAFFVNAQSDGAQQNKTGRAGTFAITNARIVTVTGAVIENGTLVITDGKITAIGTNVSIPSRAEKIDGKGLSVYPGMIDASTTLGLSEITQGANATMDSNETGMWNANAKAVTGVNPHSSHVNVTRVNGITTVMSAPRGGIVAGQATVINLNGATQSEMAVTAESGLLVNYPRISGGGGGFGGGGFGGGGGNFNTAIQRRDDQLDQLKAEFKKAEDHARAKEAYAKNKALPMVATDLHLEAMIAYVRGEKPIMFTAERERDIRSIAAFVAETKVKGIIVGGQEAHLATDVLIKNNISVIYTNIYSLPARPDDAYDVFFAAPAALHKAGVKFAISTGDFGGEARDLPYHAGLAGAYGLPREEALKAVTIYAAEILGVADKIGSLEVGKMANVVITDGDMLDPRTNIKHMFINGRLIPLTSRHTDLFDSFKDRK